MRSTVRAASAAPPPLFISLRSRPSPGLGVVFDGENAVAERKPPGDGQIHQRARALARDDVVVPGLAADDAAERHRRVIGPPRPLGRIECDGDRGRDFERARQR